MTVSEDQKTEIIEMLIGKMSVRAIAEETGISEGSVRKVGIEAGVLAQRHEEAHDIANIMEMYQDGTPVAEILATHNLTYATFYSVLARNNIPTRRVANEDSRKRQLDEAVELYKQGMRIVEITEETGVTQPTLHLELHKRSVPLRRPRQ